MLKNLTATNKGLIAGIVMVGLSLLFYYSGQPFDSPLQYVIYLVYAAAIIWTIYDLRRSEENTNKFAAFFLQGFKCFVVIALLMVVFTYIFNKMHPEFKNEMVKAYTAEMIKDGNKTPAEIATNIERAKDYYITMLISSAIFAYLLFGAVITAATSLLFLKRK